MAIKIPGAEFKLFYADPSIWIEGAFHDDCLILVDGVNAIESDIDLANVADSAEIKVEYGSFIDGPPGVPDDLVEAIQWWLDKQSSVQFTVRVPKEKLAAFHQALATLGLSEESQSQSKPAGL